MRKAAAVLLVLVGIFWPFALHILAIKRLYLFLSIDPRRWFFYGIFVVILPSPALLYSGCVLFLRDQMPYPANAVVAGVASAAIFVVTSIVFYLVVGAVGFQVPV